MSKREIKFGNATRRHALALLGAGGIAATIRPDLLHGDATAAPAQKPSGQVVIGVTQEPATFNPLMPLTAADLAVAFAVFDPLFIALPDGSLKPALAAEVPSVANGGITADGLNWRVKLKSGIKWHDEAPFTAEDVKFTIELAVDPSFRSGRTTGHSLVSDIVIHSPTEISWKMKAPVAPYLSILADTFIVPKHILGPESDRNNAPFNRAPVGTGPFKWVSRTSGNNIILAANPDYASDGPSIDRIIFKYIPDQTVLYTQFASGQVDMTGVLYVSPENFAAAKKVPGANVDLIPTLSVEAITLNMGNPLFQDAAVREAIYYSIDKQRIIDTIWYGVPTATESLTAKESFYSNPDLPKHEFDLERVKRLLDGAGWKLRSDGVRAKDRLRLSFTNSTTSGNSLREQTQLYIQQSLKSVGIEMKIANQPSASLFGEFWNLSRFESILAANTYQTGTDPDVTARLHSSSIAAKGGKGVNQGQYANPEVDRLLEEGVRTFKPEDRRPIYFKIQEIVRKDLPILPLFIWTYVRGRKQNVVGADPNRFVRAADTWNAAGWKRA
ncbi:peptide ABC transporter substrate-binding protein [Agrobacterium rosae]|uniref:peptide ABC transporter substrate-binding protein n=1 Tax=Agrobacterium rosae TaxID=1972867 RepID=UPI002033F505|nr:peptide ABC transporter substrate-binding protein [Agrobacterium rosae]MCM2436095.1 peptide ABC transporter substrate-binding protein [Agrobacterium rosae]